MKIALFHYHLKPGGVTDVIRLSTRALLNGVSSLEEIRLVTGEEEGTELIMNRIREGMDIQTAGKLKLDILPEIAYTGKRYPKKSTPAAIAERLLARYGEDTLWWVHNHHLGKNPFFTAALMEVAGRQNRRILFQIHDFPECGRYKNLQKLDSVLDTPPYPSGANIRYALINERDSQILQEAGLGDTAALLPNPVSLEPLEENNPQETKAALDKLAPKKNPGYIPGAPLLLYPVRTIRRKNVIEAALLARLINNGMNLAVTLPGVSAQEKAYSAKVKAAFTSGLIPGVWNPESLKSETINYASLTACCDAVISTSVQEGFGYMYLNALHWRKPLLARYIDILDGVLEHFGDYPRRFWADFRVPADKALIERTERLYLEKINRIKDTLNERALKSITAGVSKLSAGGGVDVSYLTPDDQIELLKRARDDGDWREQTRILNRELLESLELTLQARAPDMDSVINRHFGTASFVKKFLALVSDFGRKPPPANPLKIREAVLRAFSRLDYLRLLYDD